MNLFYTTLVVFAIWTIASFLYIIKNGQKIDNHAGIRLVWEIVIALPFMLLAGLVLGIWSIFSRE